MTTTTTEPAAREITDPDDEPVWRLTAAGAALLGYELAPNGPGEITAYSRDLNLYVSMRRR